MKHNGIRYIKIETVADGDVFDGCNLAQAAPGTEIFAGLKGLTFTRCNLARAIVPADSIIVDCNTSQMPLPPEPEIPEMIEIDAAELEALMADRAELKRLQALEASHD